jgi:hypothetical protein
MNMGLAKFLHAAELTRTGRGKAAGARLMTLLSDERPSQAISVLLVEDDAPTSWRLQDARPGDVISLDREYVNAEGKERFSGQRMCPFVAGYKLPADVRSGGCADAVDTPENRNANPPQIAGQKRDCCIRRDGADGLRVVRLMSPALWSFKKAMESIKTRDAELQKHVREFVERRKTSSMQIGLIAAGTNIVGSKKPEVAQKFVDQSTGDLVWT